jgi:hypothetical protein
MTKREWPSVIGFIGIVLIVVTGLSFNGLFGSDTPPRKPGDNELCNVKTDNPVASEKLETPQICSEDNPAASMEKDPASFATRRCAKFCASFPCKKSSCVTKKVTAPTKISVTCKDTKEICERDERKHLWDCETTVTEGSYSCSCKCLGD